MVDPDPLPVDVHPGQHLEHPLRAVGLVGQMRRVDEHELPVLHRDVDVGLERIAFVLRRLVQAGLADAKHGGLREEFGEVLEHLAGERGVLGLLRIHRHP